MKKILIVEDDRIFAKVLKDGLTGAGFSVSVAANGKEGLVAAEKESPDLIVLDLMMPELTGAEFLKSMKKNEKISNIPVIVSTQLSGMEEMSEVVTFGVRGYIIKSEQSLAEIVGQIKRTVEESASEAETK
jgi:DNA-binding response OmpR family regulator